VWKILYVIRTCNLKYSKTGRVTASETRRDAAQIWQARIQPDRRPHRLRRCCRRSEKAL